MWPASSGFTDCVHSRAESYQEMKYEMKWNNYNSARKKLRKILTCCQFMRKKSLFVCCVYVVLRFRPCSSLPGSSFKVTINQLHVLLSPTDALHWKETRRNVFSLLRFYKRQSSRKSGNKKRNESENKSESRKYLLKVFTWGTLLFFSFSATLYVYTNTIQKKILYFLLIT